MTLKPTRRGHHYEPYEQGVNSAKRAVDAPEYREDLKPEVDQNVISSLTTLLNRIEGAGTLDQTGEQEVADSFLNIYFKAERQLDDDLTHQVRLNKIADMNAYARVFSNIMMSLPEEARQPSLNAIEQAVIDKLGVVSGEVDELEEIKTFRRLQKGTRFELAAHSMLNELKTAGVIDNVRSATLDEDVAGGFDLLVTDKDGKNFKLDIKSHNSFEKLLTHDKDAEEIGEGYAIKLSHEGEPVGVIDLDTSGFDGHMQTEHDGYKHYEIEDNHQFEVLDRHRFVTALDKVLEALGSQVQITLDQLVR